MSDVEAKIAEFQAEIPEKEERYVKVLAAVKANDRIQELIAKREALDAELQAAFSELDEAYAAVKEGLRRKD